MPPHLHPKERRIHTGVSTVDVRFPASVPLSVCEDYAEHSAVPLFGKRSMARRDAADVGGSLHVRVPGTSACCIISPSVALLTLMFSKGFLDVPVCVAVKTVVDYMQTLYQTQRRDVQRL